MTTLSFEGGSTPDVTTSWTGNSKVYSSSAANGVQLPTAAQVDSKGNNPVLVSTAQVYWAGRGGSRRLRIGIGSKYSAWYTIASDSSANASGQKSIGGIFLNGGNQIVTIDEDGSSGFYFGRETGSSGSTDGTTDWGQLSGSLVYYEAPNAPTALSVAQYGLENAVDLSWNAPSDNGGTAVTSYTITWSYNSDFSGSSTVSTGSVATTYRLSGLTYGSTVYAKVAASNAVTNAAGSTSILSTSDSVFITPPDLPLDGWASFGTATGASFTLDHTVIPELTPDTGMLRHAESTNSTSWASGSFGIEKTYTDLIVGRQYILSGKAILLSSVSGNIYRFAVNGIGNGSSVTLTSTTVGATIPSYTFTASSTTHTVQIELAETLTNVGVREDVAFYDYSMVRVAVDLPYRLQDNLTTASLMDHFDLATQSVGAYWWVDKLNETNFAQDFNYVLPLGTFSDVVADGNLYYTDIQTAYDTTAVINEITFNNAGVKDNGYGDTELEGYEVEWVDSDAGSITDWGARSVSLDTNLRTTVSAQNLFPYPSFENLQSETDTTNFFYSIEQPAKDSTGAWSAYNGSVAFRAYNKTSAGTSVAISYDHRMDVTAGTTYYGIGYAATSGTPNTRARYRVQWYDDANAIIATSYGSYVSLTSYKTWYKTTISIAAPANSTYGRIGISYDRSTGAAFGATSKQWADGMYFGTTNVTDWFDGNTTDTTTYIYSWDGTNNRSTSTRYDNVLDTRTGELLAEFADPIVRVSSLKWNTAQNPIVAVNLDIGSLIIITFKGTTDTYRVVGISHDITPDRWMMELQVAKVI